MSIAERAQKLADTFIFELVTDDTEAECEWVGKLIEQALLAERRLAADLLSSHIHKFVDTPDDGFISGYGICSCGEAKADGVTIYATIWRNHLRDVVERAAAEKEVGK